MNEKASALKILYNDILLGSYSILRKEQKIAVLMSLISYILSWLCKALEVEFIAIYHIETNKLIPTHLHTYRSMSDVRPNCYRPNEANKNAVSGPA